jgi:hypothetical protein
MSYLHNDYLAQALHTERAARFEREAERGRLVRLVRRGRRRAPWAARAGPVDPPPQPVHGDVFLREIRAYRLGEVPTGELTRLAEQFHQLTIGMYEELCLRRTAELGIGQVEAMLKKHSRGPS